MTKRVFIIHGWDGSPRDAWIPWLKSELQKRKFTVITPKMPDPKSPKINAWVSHLRKQVKEIDADTYFVGHSIGCQAILRYLMGQQDRCGGAVFVAGWFTLNSESTPDAASRRIAAKWCLDPVDFETARRSMVCSTAIFSDNDPAVPLQANSLVFKKVIGSHIIIEKNKGHFDDEAGVKKLPVALKEIIDMAR